MCVRVGFNFTFISLERGPPRMAKVTQPEEEPG